MDPNSQHSKRQDNVISALNVAIDGMNLAKDILSGTPGKAACDSVTALLTMIRVRLISSPPMIYLKLIGKQDSMANRADYVELRLLCAKVCDTLNPGMKGKKPHDLSPSVRKAIEELRG